MYLKEINISGFKSFADKTSFPLDNKITCIVGPNGSGKSNVVDAVRWVLGEQSVKQLRGNDSMSDVIFSGSKSRNALNVGSVSLTFDNSDHYINVPYNEINIKRRVYRTGENEYFLNGEKCRLKDITDILIDSATSKESFNIISQGEIDKILSNSPYDRRYVFEVASGVLKYKKRKEEALRKLDRTDVNITRVNDILGEIETRIGPLEIESKKAEEYLDAKEKLQSIEVALLASDIEDTNYECTKTKKEVEELNDEIMKLSSTNLNFDTNMLELKKKALDIEKELKIDQEKLLSLTSKEEKINGEKKLLKERSKYDASDSKMHDSITSLKEDIYESENSISLLLKDIEHFNNELNEVKTNITKDELDLNNIKKTKDSINNDYDNKRKELIDTQNKIASLTRLIEENLEVPTSVKKVLNNPRISGIHGTFSSILNTKDEYIKALEVSIMSTKNYIVVDNEKVAKDSINYLKENNYGRCTFYPLNVIKPKGIDNESLDIIKNSKGFIDILSNLIDYDEKYYNVVSNQLGNVVLADNIDNANNISKSINRRYKVISLDGDVINVGGSISGGSLNKTKSIISDKKELENLERRKLELEELNKTLTGSLNEINEKLSNIQNIIYNEKINEGNIRENIITKEKLIEEINNRKTSLERDLESLSHVADNSVSKEEEKLIKEYYEVSLEKSSLEKEISNKEKEKEKVNNEIEKLEGDNKVLSSELHSKEKVLKEKEIYLSRKEANLDNYLATLSEEYGMTFEKAKSSYTLEIDADEARNQVDSYKTIIKNIGMVNVNAVSEYKEVKERFDFLNNEKTDLTVAKETLLEIIDEMDEVMKKDFLDTFNKIKVEFKKVFKELFGGGDADLKLTDSDNLLETGIDIMASPPGKKLKTISLMSGGEMTLTAISLLFAILNVRSVPFCIFDEVEAALDDANVDNFGKYLDTYKGITQFLIITHKKRTMEYADTLYGITMQESGVSKLVSVKLSSYDS